MPHNQAPLSVTLPKDITASIAVFLVALPLCLGIALASNAPLFSGLISGIVGGLLVGMLSGSHKSVSGPAAGLTAIVAAQIAVLGSFEAFLAAVVVAGLIQVVMGTLRLGFIAAFFPLSVIKGLLAAIGLILILKQIPHVFGHDSDAEGEMSFEQPDHENTFSELWATLSDIQPGAALIGILSIVLLMLWDRSKTLKKSPIPSALIVVALGVGINMILRQMGSAWAIQPSHLVQVPVAKDLNAFLGFLQFPDFAQFGSPVILKAAVTIALVATLETLLNLEAVDKIDPDQRQSPPNRELVAQGIGNIVLPFFGGIPATAAIARTSVAVKSGAVTRLTGIIHALVLVVSMFLLAPVMSSIPLAALAGVLMVTAFRMNEWSAIRYMFSRKFKGAILKYVVTMIATVIFDLTTAIALGVLVALMLLISRLSKLEINIEAVDANRLTADDETICRRVGNARVVYIAGAMIFANTGAVERIPAEIPAECDAVFFSMRGVSYLDVSCAQAFEGVVLALKKRGVRVG
ncbi:MAG TPA: sulfate transporter, partial [Verrucomicrobiales bacterium]|nr:sulfate transporter [Verrucomicrobiales bacterium]